MTAIQFVDGQILFSGGQVAMGPDCCCGTPFVCGNCPDCTPQTMRLVGSYSLKAPGGGGFTYYCTATNQPQTVFVSSTDCPDLGDAVGFRLASWSGFDDITLPACIGCNPSSWCVYYLKGGSASFAYYPTVGGSCSLDINQVGTFDADYVYATVISVSMGSPDYRKFLVSIAARCTIPCIDGGSTVADVILFNGFVVHGIENCSSIDVSIAEGNHSSFFPIAASLMNDTCGPSCFVESNSMIGLLDGTPQLTGSC